MKIDLFINQNQFMIDIQHESLKNTKKSKFMKS